MKKINLLILVFLFVMFQSNAQTVTVSMIGGNPDNCTGNSITGAYTLSSVINGKNSYVKGIHTIYWDGSKWAMDESSFEIYYNNTSTPLDPPCGTWNGTFGCFQIDLTGNCTAACVNPTTPSVTSNPTTVCLGNTATLSISGTLNDATQWSIYTGSCGGTLLDTTTSSSFVVTPSGASTTYYVRGEGGCITPGSCGSVTVNVSNIFLTPSSQTNIACNGGSTGAAAVNAATGGGGGYTYNWTPGNPTGDGTTSVTGLTAGTWTCTVTDANSCTTAQNFTVTQPTVLSLTPSSQTNIACNGGSTGAAAVNAATGGAGGYTYNWTPGNPTGDGTTSVTGLTAGTWTCTVTDANSCTASYNFTVAQPTALSLTPSSQTNIACNGGSTGAAAVNVATGGAGGYTYNWTPGNPTGDGTTSVTGLTAGTWTCTVTDANSCTTAQNFTISQPTVLTTTTSQTNVSCNGGTNGTASVLASGGTSPYFYSWSNGGTTATVTDLAPNTYNVTVTDANGCTSQQTVIITEPATLTGSQTFVECAGFSVTVGSNTYTTTGIYTDVLTGSNSCDSTVTTDLTIINISDQTVAATETVLCASNSGTTITTGSSETGVNYYLRDDANDTIVDGPLQGSGSGLTFNTGIISNTITYNVLSENIVLDAVNLPSSNDHIRFNAPFTTYGNAITVEAWINNTNNEFPWAGQGTAAVDNMTTNVWLWHGGTWYVNDNGNWRSLAWPALSAGWVHVATVADASGMYIYYNGVEVASNTTGITSNIRNNASSIIDLGHDVRFSAGTVGRNSNVGFDNFSVWNTARAAVDIATSYNDCLSGSETGLVQYTKFNEGVGTTIASMVGSNADIINPTTNRIEGARVCTPSICSSEMLQTVTITVNNITTGTDVQTACVTYTWPLNSTTYTTSTNTPTVTLTNAAGCDSIVTLDLTINSLPVITAQSGNLTSCGDNSALFYVNSAGNNTYQWYFDGISFSDFAMIDGSYTEINFDTDSMTIQSLVDGGYNNYFVYCTVTDAVTGCSINSANDSITVLEPTTGSQTFVECAGFSVTVGTNTYNTTGVFTDVLVGSNGCDSTVTTDLTIKQPTTGSQTFVECAGFSVTVGTNT
ncbi:MAG: hypothetical protein HYU68_07515, partial [Bacteroidetes bacterium]|nr:hypothetical protein [Bacteroidota bacterium]